jgi:hypothetical protein
MKEIVSGHADELRHPDSDQIQRLQLVSRNPSSSKALKFNYQSIRLQPLVKEYFSQDKKSVYC